MLVNLAKLTSFTHDRTVLYTKKDINYERYAFNPDDNEPSENCYRTEEYFPAQRHEVRRKLSGSRSDITTK